MGGLLFATATMMCPHGGQVIAAPGSTRVSLSGTPAVRAGDTFTVAACAFMIGLSPHPCTTVRWISPAQRVTIAGDSALTTDSVGLCTAADGAAQGPVQIVATQLRASGL